SMLNYTALRCENLPTQFLSFIASQVFKYYKVLIVDCTIQLHQDKPQMINPENFMGPYGPNMHRPKKTDKSDDGSGKKTPEAPTIPFSVPHFAMDVSQRRDGGVMKTVQRMGRGDEDDIPGHEDRVSIHYVAVLLNGERDGEKVESTRDPGRQPLEFVLSKDKNVVPGLHQAVKSMRLGEIATFFLRTEYAYSKRGCSTLDIPPKQHMLYEVELLSYRGEDISPEEDGSVLKSIMRRGTGYLFLPIGSQLRVSVKGRHRGDLFDSRILTFELGVGDEQGIPEGVEQACQRMIPGEKARVVIEPSYSYGIDFDKFGVPKTDTVVYEVELLSYQKPPEHFEVSAFGKLEQAYLAKDKGAHYFAKGRYKQALNHYECVLNYLEHDPDFFDVDKVEHAEFHGKRQQVLLAGRLNCAICYLKLRKFKSAIKQCDSVLQKLDAKNVKALYRRALASMGIGRLYEARDDFRAVLELEPDNSSASRELAGCLQAIEQAKRRERALCETIFRRGGLGGSGSPTASSATNLSGELGGDGRKQQKQQQQQQEQQDKQEPNSSN
ncbi:hypothetical protein BOX15_Mlig024675g1, partial [Macrostomum lignano]